VVFKEMNIVSSIAAAVCLGIVVDDTIHFLAKYQRARDEKGLPCRQALEETMRTVGGALVLTSVILIAGFAVLSQSTFAVNSTFGRLVILVVGLALMADLFILPACLAALDTEPELAPDPAADPETGITGAL
jgi:predicted RND superfamily exporter protein